MTVWREVGGGGDGGLSSKSDSGRPLGGRTSSEFLDMGVVDPLPLPPPVTVPLSEERFTLLRNLAAAHPPPELDR